jgi:endonuclease YncB( thermonuclease family)
MLELICLIIAISDGDTIKARCAEETIKIRLAEIDAPEKRQPFGQRSKQSLSDLCYLRQAKITPQTTDRYGRTVAHVACDGTNASTEQVRRGMAWVYRKYSNSPALLNIEAEAKAGGVGLWVDPEPVPPWEWRKWK